MPINLIDAQRLHEGTMKKTKVLRGKTALKVISKVSKETVIKKIRSAGDVRKAMYGKEV